VAVIRHLSKSKYEQPETTHPVEPQASMSSGSTTLWALAHIFGLNSNFDGFPLDHHVETHIGVFTGYRNDELRKKQVTQKLVGPLFTIMMILVER
jgi:hypothetical protein